MVAFTLPNDGGQCYYNIQFDLMSGSRRDKPAHNYAKPVEQLPPLRKEVVDTLSNEYSRSSLYHSGKENPDKVYFIAHNQAYYRGQWVKGMPEGPGFCVFSDGSYYEGNFEQGDANDKDGYLILPNGASYRGEVKKSMIEGEGEMRHNIGKEKSYSYKGSWKAGKPHGFGIEEYGDGSKYVGFFENGVKNCYDHGKTLEQKEEEFQQNGKLQRESTYQSAATGQTYRGEFLNGRMHGFGDYYRADREIRYTGQFFNGKKQGIGALHSETGVLSGRFENDVINGPGKFEWNQRDGRVFIGNFKNSKFHGEGQIQLPNGNILEGVWEDGHSLELKAVKRQQ